MSSCLSFHPPWAGRWNLSIPVPLLSWVPPLEPCFAIGPACLTAELFVLFYSPSLTNAKPKNQEFIFVNHLAVALIEHTKGTNSINNAGFCYYNVCTGHEQLFTMQSRHSSNGYLFERSGCTNSSTNTNKFNLHRLVPSKEKVGLLSLLFDFVFGEPIASEGIYHHTETELL